MMKPTSNFQHRFRKLTGPWLATLRPPRGERGNMLVFAIVVIAMFGVIGVHSLTSLNSASKSAANYMNSLRAFYAAESGVEFCLERLNEGLGIDEGSSYSIQGATVGLDSSLLTGDSLVSITATAVVGEFQKSIEVITRRVSTLGGYAIYTIDDINNASARDESNVDDPSKMLEYAPSMPTIDEAGLLALAASQGQVKSSSTFTPSNNYPNGSFYYSGSTPNVTHVKNDFKVNGSRTVYGIYVVDGKVTLNGMATVRGIIYVRTNDTTTITGGGVPSHSTVIGAIYSHGIVKGTGNHRNSRFNSEYINAFTNFETGGTKLEIAQWLEH